MKNKKGMIVKFLEKNGRSSTSKIAVAIKSNHWLAEKYLKCLEKEKRIKKEQETKATYWEVK